jgi:hypothetical protein
LRQSRYAYPVVNALHILSIGVLVGSILPLDLRLLGAFPSVPVGALARVLEPVAAVALLAAIVAGFLLFSVKPLEYANNPALWAKVGLIGIGILNAAVVRLTPAWRAVRAGRGTVPPWMRAAAFASLIVWSSAVFAGRFVAYIHVDPLMPAEPPAAVLPTPAP